jgi:hypothetical protein
MRFGTRSLAAEVAPKHPLEARLELVSLVVISPLLSLRCTDQWDNEDEEELTGE